MIPQPFARVTFAYSAPTHVLAASVRDAAAEAPRFEELHESVSARAAERPA